jgi:aryl-alcohol dehydrogenase-like predicted oxidoreductase
MHIRTLGNADLASALDVSAIGLGCMGMSAYYGRFDDVESRRTLNRALDLGVNFLDTADMYGFGQNEELIGSVLESRREDVVLATKFGIRTSGPGGTSGDSAIDSSPEYAVQACDASLKRLGVDVIDLYYLHRRNPEVPIEETVGAMAGLIDAGKVRHLGLSEVNADTLRRAHAVHPITALQTEFSLWERAVQVEILPTCRELGVGFVAYSPIGRGFLTGAFTAPDDLEADDFRRHDPRFAPESFTGNLELVERVREIAAGMGLSPVQLALAWLLAQGPDVVPIPGTKRVRYLEENAAAADVVLSPEQLAELTAAVPVGQVQGERYSAAALAKLNT